MVLTEQVQFDDEYNGLKISYRKHPPKTNLDLIKGMAKLARDQHFSKKTVAIFNLFVLFLEERNIGDLKMVELVDQIVKPSSHHKTTQP